MSSIAKPAHGTNRFNLNRVFKAPRELVWRAFTEPERLALWWGPQGFTVEHCSVDLRPGGLFHYGMRGPDGSVMWGRFCYREIRAPEHLAVVLSFSDEAGDVAPHPGHVGWPLEILLQFSFSETPEGTLLAMSGSAHNASAAEIAVFEENYGSMDQGFNGTWNQLDAYLDVAREEAAS